MAMDFDRLGDEIADKIIASSEGFELNAADDANFRSKMKILAKETIDEFIDAAEIAVTNITDAAPPQFTGAGTPGGPLPIIPLLGSGTGDITA